ncbi:MAG: hypothetical protein ACREN2_02470 [Candidatus Dormibacteria bacterium]
MPRPNSPRKRPRRRPDARTDAELNRQTAQSAQPRSQQAAPKPGARSSGGGGAVAAALNAPDELWSRRSYAILIGLAAATEVVIGVILFGLAPNPKDTTSLVAEMIGLQPFQPFPLLAACLLAAPVAKRISGEARALRFVETLVVGVVIYFVFIILITAVGFVLTPQGAGTGGACSTTTTVPTPLPNGSTPTPSASPSPSGTPCPSPAPSASPSSNGGPSASASPSPTSAANSVAPGTNLSTTEVLAAAGVSWVAAYVATIYIYPPLYRRLRVRRPPPGGDDKKDKGGGKTK